MVDSPLSKRGAGVAYRSLQEYGLMEEDLQGWGSSKFLTELIGLVLPRVVIEVGVWKGRSCVAMGHEIVRLGLETEIIAVDTFLGSAEHVSSALLPRDFAGFSLLYRQFLSNIVHNGLEEIVRPLPLTSLAAAQFMIEEGLKAELIHIDAGHSEQEVQQDLRAFWPLLEEGGFIVCDDYGSERWPGVTAAVTRFASETGVPVFGHSGKAIIPNAFTHRIRLRF